MLEEIEEFSEHTFTRTDDFHWMRPEFAQLCVLYAAARELTGGTLCVHEPVLEPEGHAVHVTWQVPGREDVDMTWLPAAYGPWGLDPVARFSSILHDAVCIMRCVMRDILHEHHYPESI